MKKNILVCNDDGIHAPGIRALVESVKDYGNIFVVAPDKAQSAMGHAITINKPLRINKINNIFENVIAYQCSGTPVDCIKLGIDKIMPMKPDLIVSGINHGSNASVNVIYSGTMSAALEGAIEGIPSIGFSLCDFSWEADFNLSKKVAKKLVGHFLENQIPENIALNINIPKINETDFKGIKVCRQAKARWKENFEERIDPHGKKYFWLTGVFEMSENEKDTDEWALQNNFVSIVPTQFDLTDYSILNKIKIN